MVKRKYIQFSFAIILIIGALVVANYVGRSREGSAEELPGYPDYFDDYYEMRNNPDNDQKPD